MTPILMDMLFIAFLAIIACGVKIVHGGQNCLNHDYLSIKSGKSLRGMFAIMVIFCHLAQNTSSGYLFRLNIHAGCLSVAVFFFLSGYGLQKQYLTNENYKKGFLEKRLTPIMIPYIFISFVYWLMFCSVGMTFTMKEVLVLFLLGEPIAWYSWYIICILMFYVMFWVLMTLCKKQYLWMITGSTIFCIVHILFCKIMNWGIWWYSTVHLLIFGIFWAIYEEKIYRAIAKRYWIICLTAVSLFLTLFCCKVVLTDSIGLRIPLTLIFVLCVIMIAMKIKIDSSILNYLGKISMELYLCQGLFILALRSDALYIKNDFLYTFLVLAGTIISAHLFHQANKWFLDKYKMIKQKTIPNNTNNT